MPEDILDYMDLDLGIDGDGEDSLPLLVEKLMSKQDYSSSTGPGIPCRWRIQPQSSIMRRHEELSTPSRSYIDNHRYFVEGGMGNVETKRGCDKGCIYCADPMIKGRSYRLRSPESVVDEIEALINMGVNTFHFCDSEFNLPSIHAEEVCLQIVRRKLENRIRWYTYAHPARFPAEMAILFKKAGCKGVNFGVDSGNDKVLHGLGRDFKDEHIRFTAYLCHRIDLPFMYDLLLGGPGETKETLKETIELMKELSPHRIGAALGVRIFPGTGLASMVQARGPWIKTPTLRAMSPVMIISLPRYSISLRL